MKHTLFRRPLQVGAFLRKEMVDVLRQPRLLFTLVLGPFLIMAIFGLGYRDTAQPMRTLFVGPVDSPLLDNVEQYANDIGPYVEFEGISHDQAAAEQMLMDGDIDLIVTFPDDPLATVLGGESATISVMHTRLDPVERTAISFASRLAVDQINAEVLSRIVGGAQGMLEPSGALFDQAGAVFTELDAAMAAQDDEAAATALEDLDEATTRIALSVRVATIMTERLAGGRADEVVGPAGVSLNDAAEQLRVAVADLDAGSSEDAVAAARDALKTIDENFVEFTSVDPAVLVRPLRSEVSLAVDNVDNVTFWYAPAAVILVLQQFGVAFGALSFVRERQLGIVEVLRIAPVGATVTLLGKYLAYMLIGGGIGALLTGLVVTVLDVPLASGLGQVAIVMALSLFASIGVGFLISLASANDAQAVQYTMILLLASLFFSGFFLSVGQMEGLASWVSWLLPVTYGMSLLRDVMLRGTALETDLVIGLAAYGAITFLLVLLGTRRRLRGQQ